MADQTQVSASDLTAAIGYIEEAATKLRTIQKNLDTAGVTLKASWVGQSEYAFDQVHRIWHQRMDKVLESLQTLAENIGGSNRNYAAFNEERVQAINKIEALINAAPMSRTAG
ncbi:WXG100 family type VII secretion target [[Actinomadura] parvosata]|uniref:WXG100 family type VII secretion target n=1 Tax=Nonomuraea composti TaxID=2720023 RepID=A0ABX1BSI3_9ACTN|nr:WXG100 family type VII secretion target [Nonomuraea sp. FMUSA5-5]